jgi:hypothetical protein
MVAPACAPRFSFRCSRRSPRSRAWGRASRRWSSGWRGRSSATCCSPRRQPDPAHGHHVRPRRRRPGPDLPGDHRRPPAAAALGPALADPRLGRARLRHPDLVQGPRPAPGAPASGRRQAGRQRQGRALRQRDPGRPSRLSARRRQGRRHPGRRAGLSRHRGPALAHLPQVRPGGLERAADLPEWQDPAWLAASGFPAWREALALLHNPQAEIDLSPMSVARRRLAYDELLAHQLALAQRKAGKRSHPAPRITPARCRTPPRRPCPSS